MSPLAVGFNEPSLSFRSPHPWNCSTGSTGWKPQRNRYSGPHERAWDRKKAAIAGLSRSPRATASTNSASTSLSTSISTSVHGQKHDRRHCAGTLVAIDERVVLDDVKQVGGSHLEQIGMEVLSAEARLRHGRRRFQQTGVAQAHRSAVPFDLVAVDGQNLFDLQKVW